jgi:hypothetical protein
LVDILTLAISKEKSSRVNAKERPNLAREFLENNFSTVELSLLEVRTLMDSVQELQRIPY